MFLYSYCFRCVALSLFVFFSHIEADPYVQARVWGRLGNHFFIIAAATSLALENNAKAVFPDFPLALTSEFDPNSNYNQPSLCLNYEKIFSHLNVSNLGVEPELVYQESSFNYTPIPYQPNMLLEGWFQSEKYFCKHKKEILELFAPSKEVLEYLEGQYKAIIEHPYTVSVHLRNYNKERSDLNKVYPTYGREYVEKAMNLFSEEEALFIVFSDQMEWAKEELAQIPRKMIFIEKEPCYHDIYLMSLCKHQIIANSSFSWWGAYLNKNPNKRVIAPPLWFCPEYNHNEDDLIPKEWIVLD